MATSRRALGCSGYSTTRAHPLNNALIIQLLTPYLTFNDCKLLRRVYENWLAATACQRIERESRTEQIKISMPPAIQFRAADINGGQTLIPYQRDIRARDWVDFPLRLIPTCWDDMKLLIWPWIRFVKAPLPISSALSRHDPAATDFFRGLRNVEMVVLALAGTNWHRPQLISFLQDCRNQLYPQILPRLRRLHAYGQDLVVE